MAAPSVQSRPPHSKDPLPGVPVPEEELLGLLDWFIRVRWFFVIGLGLAILYGAASFGPRFPAVRTAAVGAVVFAYNIVFYLHHRLRRARAVPDLDTGRSEALLQIGFDLLALTTLIHYVGGVESPFICLYLIHAIAGVMTLTRRQATAVGIAAYLLFLLVAVLEFSGVLPHFEPTGVATGDAPGLASKPFQIEVCIAFLASLVCTMSITSAIMSGLRLREEQLVRVQRALRENAEDLKAAYASLSEKQHQLVQTEKQASLGRLVAGIAHEINNPVQFIHGNMAIVSEAMADVLPLLDERSAAKPGLRIARLDYPFFRKQVPLLLKDMQDGAARIGTIVRDLKIFARRDEGRLEDNVDLADVVRSSLRLLHNQLKHHRVEVELATDLPRLQGSQTQLQQVVVNSLQNACDALDRGAGGTIHVRLRREPEGERLRLTVEDDGCGIPPDLLDRIFDPFFTTKQRSGGTGLGLAIAEGIIQQHQGQILVESQVGRGSSFHFVLPLQRRPATDSRPPPPRADGPRAPPLAGAP